MSHKKYVRTRLAKVRRRYRRILFNGVVSGQVSVDEIDNLMLHASSRFFRIAAKLPKKLDSASVTRREAS
jgi:hypothetical protein